MTNITIKDKDGNVMHLNLDNTEETSLNVNDSDFERIVITPDNTVTFEKGESHDDEPEFVEAEVIDEQTSGAPPQLGPYIHLRIESDEDENGDAAYPSMTVQIDGSHLDIGKTHLEFTNEGLKINDRTSIAWEDLGDEHLAALKNQEELEAFVKNLATVSITDDAMEGAKLPLGSTMLVRLTATPIVGNLVAVKYPDKTEPVIRRYNADGLYAERREGNVKETSDGARIMGVGLMGISSDSSSGSTTTNE